MYHRNVYIEDETDFVSLIQLIRDMKLVRVKSKGEGVDVEIALLTRLKMFLLHVNGLDFHLVVD